MSQLLYLTTDYTDYLQDQVLLGLKQIESIQCVDFPRKDVLYEDCTIPDSELHGNGFTIWKEFNDDGVNRKDVLERLYAGEFDALIFGRIQHQQKLFEQINQHRVNCPIIYLDGEDKRYKPSLREAVPFMIEWLKRHQRGMGGRPQVGLEFHKQAVRKPNYFKREKSEYICSNESVHPIWFSIPNSKILNKEPEKTQAFQTHVQCEIAYGIERIAENSTREPIFDSESAYYEDLACSKYGITMKKAGWECMRHYEIAANWAVPCFYNLCQKPTECPPHGLKDMYNCIIFDTAPELQRKVSYIESNDQYTELQRRTVDWVSEHTCKKTAEYVLNTVNI